MRYSKKKRRKKKRAEERSYFAFSVIVCAMVAYALYASSAGRWIISNYIEPVFKQNEAEEQTEPKEENIQSNQQQQTMSYEGFTVYTMQVGAFSSEDNAKEAAKELQNRGGAGYVLYDGSYRVLAFGYDKEEEANTVKDQLKEAASMDSSVFKVEVPGLDFKVTGEEKSLLAVDAAFKTYLSSKDKVGELAIKLDKGELTKEQVKAELDVIKQELETAIKDIDKLSKSDEKLERFHTLCTDVVGMLGEIKDSDEVVFSAQVKNIYMEMVCRYADYVKEISS